MNIAVTEEEENLFPSFAYSSFLRFTSFLSSPHVRSTAASTINPRFRWDKALVLLQLKEDNNRLRDGFVTRLLHAFG